MATEHIRISEAFLDRLQGVAKHKLRELPLIQIPDTRNYPPIQGTAGYFASRKGATRSSRHRKRKRFAEPPLPSGSPPTIAIVALSLYKRNTGAARNKGAIKPDWYSPPNR